MPSTSPRSRAVPRPAALSRETLNICKSMISQVQLVGTPEEMPAIMAAHNKAVAEIDAALKAGE